MACALTNWKRLLLSLKGREKTAKFIYIIPDFQNPAGVTVPSDRRLEIIRIAERHNVLIVEDSPYREVRFEGKSQPLLCTGWINPG